MLTCAEAFAAIALAAIACDGTLSREEVLTLRKSLEGKSLFKSCTETEMICIFDKLLKLLRKDGVDSLIEKALPILSRNQTETAIAVAAHLVHADRKISSAEEQLLKSLTEKSLLPEIEASNIIKSIEALNRDFLND